jgi:hypothetical protein
MDKDFDDLFNDFFKKLNDDELSSDLKGEASKLIEMFKKIDLMARGIDETLENQMDSALGEPDKVENYIDGGLHFERRIWHTPTGDIVKLIINDAPNKPIDTSVDEKPLDVQLTEAIAKEDYEKAAKLRDLISPPKRKVGRPKKTK